MSMNGASVTAFNNRLCVVASGADGKIRIQAADSDFHWNPAWNEIPGGGSTDRAPAVTAFNDHLCVVITGADGKIRIQAADSDFHWNPAWNEIPNDSQITIHSADDSQITIYSAQDVINKQNALIQFIWGSNGFPRTMLPSKVIPDICHSPAANVYPAKDPCSFSSAMPNLARVDEIDTGANPQYPGLAYHFVPHSTNNKLVVVHHGHACYLDDEDHGSVYGIQSSIIALVDAGYGVLGVYMPLFHPQTCTPGNHDPMFSKPERTGSPLKYFLEPTAVSLNYLKTAHATEHFPPYQEFDMIGLSGGGWTTTVYAAIDHTIKVSIPVAGSLPLYLRAGGSIGDTEQSLPAFYQIAGYPDLYVMGGYGIGRRQIQILNRHDSCCFGDNPGQYDVSAGPFDTVVRNYERKVRDTLGTLHSGDFTLVIDETSTSHQISQHAIQEVILPQLVV